MAWLWLLQFQEQKAREVWMKGRPWVRKLQKGLSLI